MTREEAKNILGQVVTWYYDKLHGYPKLEYIAEAAEIILSQPSLPSNLDEAAIRVANEMEIPTERSQPESLTLVMRHIAARMFKAGAEWMAGRGWISVDEKLPELDEEVIVLTDEHNTTPIYKIGFGHIVDVERCIDYNGWNIPGVKYWMPCPKIPNSD